MLSLSVSTQSCLLGKTLSSGKSRPQQCETCEAPGGERGELLDEHIVGAKGTKFLCQLCHSCLHLDVAGRMNAGRIIWLPELSQEELNILCLASFVTLRKAGVYRKHSPTQTMRDQIVRLYKTFEKRSEAVEQFLGGGQPPVSRQALSNPTYVASLILRAQKDASLDARTVAKRVNGLRLLPYPQAFESYIAQVARIATSQYPVNTWMESVSAQMESAKMDRGDAEQFDADFAGGYS